MCEFKDGTVESSVKELSLALRKVDHDLHCAFCGKSIGNAGDEFYLLEEGDSEIALCTEKCWIKYFFSKIESKKQVLVMDGVAINTASLSIKKHDQEGAHKQKEAVKQKSQLAEQDDAQGSLNFSKETKEEKSVRHAVIQKLVDAGEKGCSLATLKRVGATSEILNKMCCATIDENGYKIREDGLSLVERFIYYPGYPSRAHSESRFFIRGKISIGEDCARLGLPQKTIYECKNREKTV